MYNGSNVSPRRQRGNRRNLAAAAAAALEGSSGLDVYMLSDGKVRVIDFAVAGGRLSYGKFGVCVCEIQVRFGWLLSMVVDWCSTTSKIVRVEWHQFCNTSYYYI